MQKPKKSKEVKSIVNPNPQTYITAVSDIFLHPTELLYIIVDSQGRLRMFDLPTMSLIGKSYIKIDNGYSIYKCMFSKDDFGLFYTLCRKEQEEEPEEDGRGNSGTRLKIKRYHYMLNMHYLSKKGQILCSTCEVNLNGSQDKMDMEQKIEVRPPNRLTNNQTVWLTNYQKMQKEREKFILQYYSEEHNEIKNGPQPTPHQPPEWQSFEKGGIGQIIEQEHDYSDRSEGMEVVQNGAEKQLEQEVDLNVREGSKGCKAPEGILPYLKFHFCILELSRYAQTSRFQPNNSSPKNIHFTVLCTDGFHLCSLNRKIKEIGFEATQIVVGANICGNIDSCSTPPFQQIHNNYIGNQFGDVWIVFSPSQCFLVEVGASWRKLDNLTQMEEESKQFTIYSKLTFNLDSRFYSNIIANTPPYENQLKNPMYETSNILVLDYPKKLCLALSVQSCLCLISYDKLSLQIIAKIKLDNFCNLGNSGTLKLASMVNFFAIARFGVNTSTTNKYESKVMVLVGVSSANSDEREKQKQKDTPPSLVEEEPRDFERQKEKQKERRYEKSKEKQFKQSCIVYIYSVDLKTELSNPQGMAGIMPNFLSTLKPHESTEQLVTVLRGFPISRKIWYCEYLQNRINFINYQNQVQMIELCRLLDGKHIGKQWVNLGYRFEALEVNQLYEELEDEFELTAEQSKDSGHNIDGIGTNGIRQKLNQLNDWSYSLLSRDVILNKKLKKLNCVDL